LAGGDSALDFGCKGLDIASASYVGELNVLGGMNVGVGNVSAEMHNQSVNSLALISSRYTLTALEVAQLLAATHLYVVCQALDLRALYLEMRQLSAQLVRDLIRQVFLLSDNEVVNKIATKVVAQVHEVFDRTVTMDTVPRMAKVASEATSPLLEALLALNLSNIDLNKVTEFRTTLSAKLVSLLTELRCAYLNVPLSEVRTGSMQSTLSPTALTPIFNLTSRGRAPASELLAPRTRVLYQYVREELGIPMYGADNVRGTVFGMRDGLFSGPDAEDITAMIGGEVDTSLGDKVTIIVEALRDGRLARVLVRACAGI